MATPRIIKKDSAEYKANIAKQQYLKQHGYNIKVDGTWGPHLQELYNKTLSEQGVSEYYGPALQKVLNKAGEVWHSAKKVLDTPYTTTALDEMGHPIVQADKSLAKSTSTPGQDITSAVAGVTLPISIATVGPTATAIGLTTGAIGGYAGSKVGSTAVSLMGGSENAQEMGAGLGGFLGGSAGGYFTPQIVNASKFAFNTPITLYKINKSLTKYPLTKEVINYLPKELRWNIVKNAYNNPTATAFLRNPTTFENFNKGLTEAKQDGNFLSNGLNFLRIVDDVTEKNGYTPTNFKFMGSPDYWADNSAGFDVTSRFSGEYPLTMAERRNWVTQFKNDINRGVEHATQQALTYPWIKDDNHAEGTALREAADEAWGKYMSSNSDEDLGNYITLQEQYHKQHPNYSTYQRILDNSRKQYFGTAKAINTYNPADKRYPAAFGYGAYSNPKDATRGTYYPFRYYKGTLMVNKSLDSTPKRIQVGAHEMQHQVQDVMPIQLTNIKPKTPKEYGRYTNPQLNEDLYNATESVINSAGTAGKWAGSLSEMDSEMAGWTARMNVPSFTQASPEQQNMLLNAAVTRFSPKNPELTDTYRRIFTGLDSTWRQQQ